MKHKLFITTLFFIPIIIIGYNHKVFPVEFFKLFSGTDFSENRLREVRNFDISYNREDLPVLEDKELFESIDDLSICREIRVRTCIYMYLTTGREYLVKSIERSYFYIDIINEIMKKNPDIPEDIALLPLLESGFNPYAVSRSNAVGLWQFIRSTSAGLDIKSNSLLEERRDIEKSTEGAIRHLRYLHRVFKSWGLALAAYNGGEGQITRAMNRTGAKNIWELIESGKLTRETTEFVPRYAALVVIYNNMRLFGLDRDITPPRRVKTEIVKLDYQLNIKILAAVCDIDPEEIKRYNPELNGHITPPASDNYQLRLTEESARKYHLNINNLYAARIDY